MRERWLTEANEALAEAERLTGLLASERPHRDLVLASLQSHIIALRREIERLKRSDAGERRREFHPNWTENSAWCQIPNGN